MDIKHRRVNKRVRITDKNNLPLANQEIGFQRKVPGNSRGSNDRGFIYG